MREMRSLFPVFLGALLSSALGHAGDRRGVDAEAADVETYAPPRARPADAARGGASRGERPPHLAALVRPPRHPAGRLRDSASRGGQDLPGDRSGRALDAGGLGTVYGSADVPEVPLILLPDDPAPSASDNTSWASS